MKVSAAVTQASLNPLFIVNLLSGDWLICGIEDRRRDFSPAMQRDWGLATLEALSLRDISQRIKKSETIKFQNETQFWYPSSSWFFGGRGEIRGPADNDRLLARVVDADVDEADSAPEFHDRCSRANGS